jgi:FKBP-type peptidyl-prolyl cis-trans isomerase
VREIHTVGAVLVAGLLCGCGEAAPDQSHLPPERRVATRYAAELRVDLAAMEPRPTGLYTLDVVTGDGLRADSGDVALVHYTGWLPSGVEFDTSRDGNPLEVALGYGRVIAGWDQGVVGMKVGGRRRLIVPPALGYGSQGRGRIPSNSTLVFDVELLEVEDRTPQGEGGTSTGGP